MAYKTLFAGGTVYSGDPEIGVIEGGDVLVENGRIVAVGHKLTDPDADFVDCRGMIVMPGLVDTHRHTWQTALRQVGAEWTLGDYIALMIGGFAPTFRPDDVRVGNLLGALEAIDSGVTTLMDWSHITNSPEHANAAVAGLRDSRIRAVYGYGSPTIPAAGWWADDFRRIARTHFTGDGGRGADKGLITLALASSGPEFEGFEQTRRDIELAREVGVMTSLHVGVGMLAQVGAIAWLDEQGPLGDDLIFVHGTMLSDADLAAIARTGGHVSVSPRIEMHMGHGYPATGRMIAAGLAPSLSLDVVSGVGGSLFADLRTALEAEHAEQNRLALQRGEWTPKLDFTTADAIAMATINGARALGLDSEIGTLTPGKAADIIVVRPAYGGMTTANNLEGAIALTEPENVRHVYVAGRALKFHGVLVEQDVVAITKRAAASREYLVNAADAAAVAPVVDDVPAIRTDFFESPSTDGYLAATATYNLLGDLRPEAAVVATCVDHVVEAVETARRTGKNLGVYSTGHAARGMSSLADELLVRVAFDAPVRIDAERKIATIPAGALWGEVVERAAEHGLAALHGSSATVSAIGYLLRGGLSFYGRLKGVASNSLLSVTVVTADRGVVRADAHTEPDLFWAIRGGGGGFGIVVEVELELFPMAKIVTGFTAWDASDAATIAPLWRDWTDSAPREVSTSLRLMNLPPLPGVPEALTGRQILVLDGAVSVPTSGDLPAALDMAAELLEPLRAAATPLMDTWHTADPIELPATHMDPPDPVPFLTDHFVIDNLDDAAIATWLTAASPGSQSVLIAAELRQIGGAFAEGGVGAGRAAGGAFSSLAGQFAVFNVGVPMGLATPELVVAFQQRIRESLAAYNTGFTAPTFVEEAGSQHRNLPAAVEAEVDVIRGRFDSLGVFERDVVRATIRPAYFARTPLTAAATPMPM